MAFSIWPRARRDLQEIWVYIAQDSEDAADHWYDSMRKHFGRRDQNPRMGRDTATGGGRGCAAGRSVST